MAGQRSKENVKSPAKRKLAPCLLAWVDRSRRPPGVGAQGFAQGGALTGLGSAKNRGQNTLASARANEAKATYNGD